MVKSLPGKNLATPQTRREMKIAAAATRALVGASGRAMRPRRSIRQDRYVRHEVWKGSRPAGAGLGALSATGSPAERPRRGLLPAA
ncbi:MAG: hypothetical protein DCC67_16950 [Planctomycetota bacterium]|nr:MAG: hypothetical protein DCC67_16950 [Planctomycetota bacterium]